MRIVCVGAGPAGLFTGLLLKLRHPEYDVEVLERSAPGQVDGWGVVLWQNGIDAVTAADPETGRALVQGCYRWQGTRVERGTESEVDDGAYGYAIARRDLLTVLSQRAADAGVRVTYGHEADPADLPAAQLVVAADGVGSRIRRACGDAFGHRIESSRNRYVWLGVAACLESFVFGFVQTEFGWLWCHGYGHAPDRSTLIVECEPQTWKGLQLAGMTTDGTLTLLERLLATQLGGARLLAPPNSGDHIDWLTFATVTNVSWHHDNVVLVGDAAHTTHFSIGSGTRLALLDAIALVDALDKHTDIPTALTAYESARRPEVERAQSDATRSLTWFESLPRYCDLPISDFADLLRRRRSSLLQTIPPRAYLRLRRLADGKAAITRSLHHLRAR